jgi:hypothetical protein
VSASRRALVARRKGLYASTIALAFAPGGSLGHRAGRPGRSVGDPPWDIWGPWPPTYAHLVAVAEIFGAVRHATDRVEVALAARTTKPWWT